MPTHYPGSPEQIRALNAYIRLTRAVEALSARLLSGEKLEGLTVSQLGVLDALLYLGPMYQKDLAGKILKSSGNLTLVIDNLEKRGLVQRERQGSDRRFVTIFLTGAGRALIERVMPRHADEITTVMSALTPEEQQTLGELCKKLGLSL
ncbi:MAG TPA: MarR family transcriptional regulator [Anaerolineae bacterium]|jgi:MarR family 2-MHQ and catechol resistance regulon transcriptional repressor|nr:MarR family transcriptional regulator [Anaerolineae bacterium]